MVSYYDPEEEDTSRQRRCPTREQIQRREQRKRERIEKRGELDFDDAFVQAKEDALTMLDFMNRSRKDIVHRLHARGYNMDVCEAVADRLIEVNIIDDRSLARALVRDRFELKGVVGKALYQELYRKGISADLAKEVIEELDTQMIQSRLDELIAKKIRTMPEGLPADKKRQRMLSFLMRKGYTYDQINRSYHPD